MSALAFPSWLSGGAMPLAPIAGEVHRPLLVKRVKLPKPPKRPRAAPSPHDHRKLKAARPIPPTDQSEPLPTIIPSLRERINVLLVRKLDAATALSRINNRLVERLKAAMEAL